MANNLFQSFIDAAKTIAGYPITVANAVFMRDGSTLDEFSENIPHREDDENTDIEVPNIDADMLNGHPADYYAKQSDLSALNTSVTQANNKIGNTDVSKWGNSLTGAIKAACDKSDANEAAIADVNSKLEKQIIISQAISIENSIGSYGIIVNKFSKQPPTGYALLEAFHPASGMITRFYLNYLGNLYATDAGVTKTGEWWINGAYIAK